MSSIVPEVEKTEPKAEPPRTPRTVPAQYKHRTRGARVWAPKGQHRQIHRTTQNKAQRKGEVLTTHPPQTGAVPSRQTQTQSSSLNSEIPGESYTKRTPNPGLAAEQDTYETSCSQSSLTQHGQSGVIAGEEAPRGDNLAVLKNLLLLGSPSTPPCVAVLKATILGLQGKRQPDPPTQSHPKPQHG